MKKLVLFLLTSSVALAQTPPLEELIALARQGPAAPGLKDRITKTLSARGGNGRLGPGLSLRLRFPRAGFHLDRQPARRPHGRRSKAPRSGCCSPKCAPASRTPYQYYAAGKPLGARGDAIGYNPDSYAEARRAARQGQREADHRQQDLRRHEIRLLGLRLAGSRSRGARGPDGLAGRPGPDRRLLAHPALHRHRKPGRAETAAAHRARDDRARAVDRRAAPCGPSSTTR